MKRLRRSMMKIKIFKCNLFITLFIATGFHKIYCPKKDCSAASYAQSQRDRQANLNAQMAAAQASMAQSQRDRAHAAQQQSLACSAQSQRDRQMHLNAQIDAMQARMAQSQRDRQANLNAQIAVSQADTYYAQSYYPQANNIPNQIYYAALNGSVSAPDAASQAGVYYPQSYYSQANSAVSQPYYYSGYPIQTPVAVAQNNNTQSRIFSTLTKENVNQGLLEAVQANNSDSVSRWLYLNGADVRTKDQFNNTLLMIAAGNAHASGAADRTTNAHIVKQLLDKAVQQLSSQEVKNYINFQNDAGETALIIAIHRHFYFIVEALLQYGADWSIEDSSGKNAASYAQEYADQFPEIYKLVMEYKHKSEILNAQ